MMQNLFMLFTLYSTPSGGTHHKIITWISGQKDAARFHCEVQICALWSDLKTFWNGKYYMLNTGAKIEKKILLGGGEHRGNRR